MHDDETNEQKQTYADSAEGSNAPMHSDPPVNAKPAPAAQDFLPDLSRLRLSQDYGEALGLKKLVTGVAVQKPDKTWWIRTHPSDDYRLPTRVIELTGKSGKEIYLVSPELRVRLAGETTFVPRLLITSLARPGNILFLWPIPLSGPDGRLNPWHQSAMDAAIQARDRWIRVQAKMEVGAYDVMTTEANLAPPEWPDVSFQELLRCAFKNFWIDDWEHPVLRRLRGQV